MKELLAKFRFARGCHGKPERCLTWNGKKMKICARCFGILMGVRVAIVLCLFQSLPPWWVSVLIVVPMAIDGGLQQVFGIMSNNSRRLITGVLGGFGMGAICWGTIAFCVQWTMAWIIRWTVDYVTH